MIDWYILKRGEGVFGQTGPPGYFLIVFLVGLFAFSSFFLVGVKQQLVSFFVKRERNENSIFFVAWLMAGWFVYELINSKLPAYAIGAFPAISLIIADQIEHYKTQLSSNLRWYGVTSIIQLIITLAIGVVFVFLAFDVLEGWAQAASLIAGIVTVGFAIFLYKNKEKNFLLLCLSALIPSFLAWTFIIGSIEEERCTTKTVANVVAEHYQTSAPVLFTKDFSLPSLPFYLAVRGFTYLENQDYTTYETHLKKGGILIFDQEGLQVFREQHHELAHHLRQHQIDGWIPDRGKRISYVVVSLVE
jgi:4-amino-4-deoxy-L-arabinose transferase-like glycosyltransferase